MKHTPDQIRRENGVVWRDVFRVIGLEPFKTFSSFRRDLVNGLKKRELMNAARGFGPSSCWMVEAALLEAMRRANKGELQTDIEDFVPTTQPSERLETPVA